MSLKNRIIDAAHEILVERGVAATTTKQIAARAGCAEGSIYRHFTSKEALLLEVMTSRLPGLITMIKSLHERVGTGEVHDHLVELCRTAVDFYAELLPITAAALGTPGLREGLAGMDAGPHRANQGVAAYLEREQARGRVSSGCDPAAVAALLLGACQQRSVMANFAPPEPLDDTEFCRSLIDALWLGLRP